MLTRSKRARKVQFFSSKVLESTDTLIHIISFLEAVDLSKSVVSLNKKINNQLCNNQKLNFALKICISNEYGDILATEPFKTMIMEHCKGNYVWDKVKLLFSQHKTVFLKLWIKNHPNPNYEKNLFQQLFKIPKIQPKAIFNIIKAIILLSIKEDKTWSEKRFKNTFKKFSIVTRRYYQEGSIGVYPYPPPLLFHVWIIYVSDNLDFTSNFSKGLLNLFLEYGSMLQDVGFCYSSKLAGQGYVKPI